MSGPYLKAAFLCEGILEEENKTVSAIRIVDRLELTAPRDRSPAPPYPIHINLFVSVLAGDATGFGEHTVTVRGSTPTGVAVFTTEDIPVVLAAAPESTFNIRGELQLGTPEEGLHWFEVLIDKELRLRLPLFVAVRK
jgi:hypothetical protein